MSMSPEEADKLGFGQVTAQATNAADKAIELGGKGFEAGKRLGKSALEATTVNPDKLKETVSTKWKEWTTKKSSAKP